MPPTFTIGIEEEYQTIDPETRDLRSHIHAEILEKGKMILQERVKAGLDRARAQGKRLGRPSIDPRKVKAITEELCGHEFSSATISRIVGQLDAELEKFAKRRLEEPYPYLVLDARYEKVREDGAVRSQAVLVAIGMILFARMDGLTLRWEVVR